MNPFLPLKDSEKNSDYLHGKYLAFLDSDDYWMKDKLSKSVKVLEKGADFIYHDCILFSKDFKKICLLN